MRTPRFRFDNMDANESAFFSRQLEQIRTRTYDIKYPALKARTFLPVDNEINPGADTVVYRQYDDFGVAAIISNYAEDLPRSDTQGKEFRSPIKSLGASYGYSVQEIRSAQFAGVPLEQRKANSAKKSIENRIEIIARSGDAGTGLLGFLTQPNASTFTVPNNAGATSKKWKDKTADEILADMFGISNGIVTDTKEVEIPDTLLLPLDQYGRAATTRLPYGTDNTVLGFFQKTTPYIRNVAPWQALKGAGGGDPAKDRMVCYRRDPDALVLVIPQEFEQFAPERKGLAWVTACHARCGGVIVYYPLSMAYGDGI